MSIREITQKICSRYELSPLDAEILLSLALAKPKEYLLAHPEKNLTKTQLAKFKKLAERRSVGEPVAYIAGKKEFFGLDFIVNKNVLVPRPETEMLVELATKKAETQNFASLCENDKLTIIDVGTGSGNIIISITKNIPQKTRNKINFYALDISKAALNIARRNAEKHKVEKKIKFIHSDLLDCFSKNKKIKTKNLLIVANLPYVSPALYRKNKNNLKHEPKNALVSPDKGTSHYKKLFKQISSLIIGHCSLIVEISPAHTPEISRILKKYLPKTKSRYLKDPAGKHRVAEIES